MHTLKNCADLDEETWNRADKTTYGTSHRGTRKIISLVPTEQAMGNNTSLPRILD